MTGAPRILVMGAGSIGERHIGNLVDLGAQVEFVDPSASRSSVILETTPSKQAFEPSPEDYDGIVIASPNSMHREQLDWALSGPAVVLVEKPMVTATSELDNAILGRLDRILVGYNLRFHTGYGELRRRLLGGDIGRPLAARLWFGSYLPDWRPTIDYRESYSARRELGGGVLRDASHELDLAAWFFGWPLSVVSSWIGRVGDLEIDVEDTVRAVLETTDGTPVSIDLDYLSRTYRRGIEIVGTEGTARFDWPLRSVTVERPGASEVFDVTDGVDESYVRLARAFLARVRGDRDVTAADGTAGHNAARLVELIEERA
jgi:predicted dehydrogenase